MPEWKCEDVANCTRTELRQCLHQLWNDGSGYIICWKVGAMGLYYGFRNSEGDRAGEMAGIYCQRNPARWYKAPIDMDNSKKGMSRINAYNEFNAEYGNRTPDEAPTRRC